MARESFEIYYFQNGRWSVHASFEGNQRDLALAEAHKVDKTLGYPVRLVRETYYPETNSSEEVVSWQSAKAKQMPDADTMFGEAPKPAAKKSPPRPKPVEKRKEEEPPPPPKPKPKAAPIKKAKPAKPKKRGVLTKLAIVVSMSLLLSILAAALTAAAIYMMVATQIIPEADRSHIVAAMFVVTYIVSALYHLGKQFDIKYGWRSSRPAQQGPSAADMMQRMRQNAGQKDKRVSEDGFDQTDIETLRQDIAAEDAAAETGDRGTLDEDFATTVQAPEPAAMAELPPEPAPVAAPAPPPPPPIPEPVRAPEKREEPKPALSSAEADARQGFMAFVGDAMAVVTREQPQLNAFSRFGVNLYLAGACAAAGQAKRIGRTPQLTILRDGLQAAGNTRERAETFCTELPTYGKNPRYAGMIQAGNAAMSRQISGQPANANELGALLSEWAKPEKRPSVPSTFTFLFTDIVNSTALTSQLGNAGAQRVVRAHNTAVRGAIQAYDGREVKHTGDGIMATFPSPAAAVQAAIRAQKELVQHSASNPTTAFTIRIGINVGEAVEEDNDFFGAAVQMTARICSACTPANVWVSRAVVDACKGQRIGFIPRGAFQMKGIQQARPLYEVAYTDAHRNELANL